MAVVTFSETLGVADFTWGQLVREISSGSQFSLGQSVGVAGPLWLATIAQSNIKEVDSGAWQVLAMRLAKKADRLELWNLLRPEPLGTLRGTLTFNGAHAQNATTLLVSGGAGQAGATIKAGDYLGMGSATTQQVVVAQADATADGAGNISIDISLTPLRNSFSGGASVVWSKPKALFRHTASRAVWKYSRGKMVSGIALDLIENWLL